MGVLGLSTFARRQCRAERLQVDRASSRAAEAPLEAWTVALDALGLAYFAYAASGLDWRRGGELASFRAHVEEQWVLPAVRHGRLALVLVVDAIDAVDAAKQACTLRRRDGELSRIRRHDACDLDGMVLPLLALDVLVHTFRAHGMQVLSARGPGPGNNGSSEADPLLARVARQCAGGRCVVASNDSDMLLFDGVQRVAAFDDLAFADDGDFVARVRVPAQVATALKLRRTQLVELGCLVGLDRGDAKQATVWRRTVLAKAGKAGKASSRGHNSQTTLVAAAQFLRTYPDPAKLLPGWTAALEEARAWHCAPPATHLAVAGVADARGPIGVSGNFSGNFSRKEEEEEAKRQERQEREEGQEGQEGQEGKESEMTKEDWWWPRPVLERLPRDVSIAHVLAPVRHVAVAGYAAKGRQEWLPVEGRCYRARPVVIPPEAMLRRVRAAAATVRTLLSNTDADTDAGTGANSEVALRAATAVVEVAAQCLHFALCAADGKGGADPTEARAVQAGAGAGAGAGRPHSCTGCISAAECAAIMALFEARRRGEPARRQQLRSSQRGSIRAVSLVNVFHETARLLGIAHLVFLDSSEFSFPAQLPAPSKRRS